MTATTSTTTKTRLTLNFYHYYYYQTILTTSTTTTTRRLTWFTIPLMKRVTTLALELWMPKKLSLFSTDACACAALVCVKVREAHNIREGKRIRRVENEGREKDSKKNKTEVEKEKW